MHRNTNTTIATTQTTLFHPHSSMRRRRMQIFNSILTPLPSPPLPSSPSYSSQEHEEEEEEEQQYTYFPLLSSSPSNSSQEHEEEEEKRQYTYFPSSPSNSSQEQTVGCVLPIVQYMHVTRL